MDKAAILITSNGQPAPCYAYLEFNGSMAVEYLKDALPRMRRGDAYSSMARLIGCIHQNIAGNRSLGVLPVPSAIAGDIQSTQGEAGVVIYDCASGRVTCHGGRLEQMYPRPIDIGLPPW